MRVDMDEKWVSTTGSKFITGAIFQAASCSIVQMTVGDAIRELKVGSAAMLIPEPAGSHLDTRLFPLRQHTDQDISI